MSGLASGRALARLPRPQLSNYFGEITGRYSVTIKWPSNTELSVMANPLLAVPIALHLIAAPVVACRLWTCDRVVTRLPWRNHDHRQDASLHGGRARRSRSTL